MRPILASLLHTVISAALILGAGVALAFPPPPAVVSGSAAVQGSGGTLTIQNGAGAILNWDSFDIATGTTTNFVQSSASSAVLNRVLTGTPTIIYGDLRTNGGLILINPAGFYIAPGARIDASFLTLSTFNLSNADFLAGVSNFVPAAGSGSIVIDGTLSVAGNLSLYASSIMIDGPLQTPSGFVVFPPVSGVDITATAGGGGISIGQGGSLSLGGGTDGGIITIQAAIPEPSTYALLLVGLASLGALARRRSS